MTVEMFNLARPTEQSNSSFFYSFRILFGCFVQQCCFCCLLRLICVCGFYFVATLCFTAQLWVNCDKCSLVRQLKIAIRGQAVMAVTFSRHINCMKSSSRLLLLLLFWSWRMLCQQTSIPLSFSLSFFDLFFRL